MAKAASYVDTLNNEIGGYLRLLVTGLATAFVASVMTCSDTGTGAGDADDTPAISYETCTITAAGGTHTFESGITVTYPAGCVTEDTEISIGIIADQTVAGLLSYRGTSAGDVIGAFDAKPDGLTFAAPITVTLPVDVDPGAFPIVHDVDLETGVCVPAEIAFTLDPSAGTVGLDVSHFSGRAVTELDEMSAGADECAATPCRCGAIRVEQSDRSAVCESGDCQITSSSVSVQFLECDGQPVEQSTYEEIGDECAPRIALTASRSRVSPTETATVTATVTVGCGEPVADQTVTFSPPSLGYLTPLGGATDAAGQASVMFMAGQDPGITTINAQATVRWHSYSISASAGGITDTAMGPQRQATVSGQTGIEIVDERSVERWQGRFSRNLHHRTEISGPDSCDYTYTDRTHDIAIDFTFTFDRNEIGNVLLIDSITATATQQVTIDYQCALCNFARSCEVGAVDCPPDLVLDDCSIKLGRHDGTVYVKGLSFDDGANAPLFTYEQITTTEGEPFVQLMEYGGAVAYYCYPGSDIPELSAHPLVLLQEGTQNWELDSSYGQDGLTFLETFSLTLTRIE